MNRIDELLTSIKDRLNKEIRLPHQAATIAYELFQLALLERSSISVVYYVYVYTVVENNPESSIQQSNN